MHVDLNTSSKVLFHPLSRQSPLSLTNVPFKLCSTDFIFLYAYQILKKDDTIYRKYYNNTTLHEIFKLAWLFRVYRKTSIGEILNRNKSYLLFMHIMKFKLIDGKILNSNEASNLYTFYEIQK